MKVKFYLILTAILTAASVFFALYTINKPQSISNIDCDFYDITFVYVTYAKNGERLYSAITDKNENITVWSPVRLCLYLSAFCFVVTIIWYQVPILFGEDFVFLVGLSSGLLFASGISAVLQALTGYFQRKTKQKQHG